MINEQQDAALSEAAGRAKQDRKTPFVINIHDGRLMPNTPRIRLKKDYRPYHGRGSASIEERMAYLRTEGRGMPAKAPAVVDSDNFPVGEPPPPPFDISKASKEELITFAASQYGKVIEPNVHFMTARKMVREFARQAGELEDLT